MGYSHLDIVHGFFRYNRTYNRNSSLEARYQRISDSTVRYADRQYRYYLIYMKRYVIAHWDNREGFVIYDGWSLPDKRRNNYLHKVLNLCKVHSEYANAGVRIESRILLEWDAWKSKVGVSSGGIWHQIP